MSQDQISSGISGWCHATFIIIIYPKSLQSSCVLLPTPMNLAPLVSPAINFWRRDTAFLARKDSKTANSKPTAWQMNDFFDRGSSSNQHFLRGTCEFSEVVLPLNLWWLSAISGEPNKKKSKPFDRMFFVALNAWWSALGRRTCPRVAFEPQKGFKKPVHGGSENNSPTLPKQENVITVDGSEIPRPTTGWMFLKPCI